MKKFVLILISIAFFAISNAQVSGYMGKKFSIIYSGGLGFPHLSSYAGFSVRLPLNHALNAEYIIGNSVAVGAGYKLAMNTSPNATKYNVLKDYVENNKFYSHTFAGYFKFYRRNALAPVGTFTKVGIGFQQLVLHDIIRPLENRDMYNNVVISIQNYSQFDIVFDFGVGRNWIIGDRVLLGFQVETGFTPASLLSSLVIIGNDNLIYNGTKSVEPILGRFNFSNEILRLSLNIGFLAF